MNDKDETGSFNSQQQAQTFAIEDSGNDNVNDFDEFDDGTENEEHAEDEEDQDGDEEDEDEEDEDDEDDDDDTEEEEKEENEDGEAEHQDENRKKTFRKRKLSDISSDMHIQVSEFTCELYFDAR